MSGKGKGGSYPHYPSRMKYELPVPFTPLGPPSDAYRDGWERIFAGRDAARVQDATPVQPAECEACGANEGHYVARGRFYCEEEQ